MSTLHSKISLHLDTYLSSFNASNFTKASTYYHTPALSISASNVALITTPSAMVDILSTTVDRLRRDGFDHSEWVGEKTVVVLEDEGEKGLVMASCGCKRVRKNGTSCEEFTATYTLRKVEGEWLIVSIHQHPLSTQLR